MNLNLNIDDTLLEQAWHVSGVSSERELLESALRALIAQEKLLQLQKMHTKGIGKVSEKLSPVEFESPDMQSVYQGAPLSLAEMDASVLAEAEQRK